MRMITSLLVSELTRSRRSDSFRFDTQQWRSDTALTSDRQSQGGPASSSLDLDSLELVTVATAVNTLFQLHHSGLEDYLLRRRQLGQWVELVQEARARRVTSLAFSSSGTTGAPKVCEHPWASLVDEVTFFARHFQAILGRPIERVVAPSPCHHIYGCLFGVMMPQLLDVPVLSGPTALNHVLSGRAQPGDLLVGFPFLWQQAVRAGRRFPEGVMALTSTERCEPDIFKALQGLGVSLVMEIYGSSETAGIGYRAQPEQPFELLPRWQRAQETDAITDVTANRLYVLPDEIQWHGARQLTPVRRKDLAVQVGGVNVYPQRIASQLESLNFIAGARVDLRPASEGGRLEAVIKPISDSPTEEQMRAELNRWCSDNLSSPERPRIFRFETD
ncbi:AMP-binding protein [Mangrovitalea sediminis]|uniref:AMP-binding protein n=1 Tax=Mangrovitalea sediminis TaxID=1982043 RepID=UPI001177A247|nr:AMP-binding protein [Mangrovitalea sediminis]